MKAETAIFGRISMIRMLCPECGNMSLVIDGRSACCDVDHVAPPEEARPRRVSDGSIARHLPSEAYKRQTLDAQGGRCIYCDGEFGSYVYIGIKPKKLKINWDHFVAWSFDGNNEARNFVAACQVCNMIKGNKYFPDVVSAKEYICEKRRNKNIQTDDV